MNWRSARGSSLGRRLESSARIILRGLQRLVPHGRPGVTVFAFHLVGAGTGSPVDIPVELFVRILEELREEARVLHLTAAAEALRKGEVDREVAVITFDDAYANFLEVAWPVLDRLDLPSTLFVPTDFVDGKCAGPLRGVGRLRALSWASLKDLGFSGRVELGSHTKSHPDLRSLSRERVQQEVAGGQIAVRERTGLEPRAFAYPRGLWSGMAEEAVRRTHEVAVIGGGRKNRQHEFDAHRIERVSVRTPLPGSLLPYLRSVSLEEVVANKIRTRDRRRNGPVGFRGRV